LVLSGKIDLKPRSVGPGYSIGPEATSAKSTILLVLSGTPYGIALELFCY